LFVAVLYINEIRTGVVHIASLLQANESLLSNLPCSSPPMMKSQQGIAKILGWCEVGKPAHTACCGVC
jgi:hypothetical protein